MNEKGRLIKKNYNTALITKIFPAVKNITWKEQKKVA
jgi:hypothetical protein